MYSCLPVSEETTICNDAFALILFKVSQKLCLVYQTGFSAIFNTAEGLNLQPALRFYWLCFLDILSEC